MREKITKFFKLIWFYIVWPFKKLHSFLKPIYKKYIKPVIEKIIYFIGHNFIIRHTDSHLILFSKFKIKKTRKRREMVYGFTFISIWIVGYLIFSLYPVIFSFLLSFQKAFFSFTEGFNGTFVGISNYVSVFSNQNVLPLLINYLGQVLISVPIIIVFALIIALLINQPIKGKGIWRTIFFLPVVISTGPVITTLINQNATTLPSLENNSVIEFIVSNMGNWVSDPLITIMDSLLLILWYAGIPILIFLAALQKNDRSIYEAAEIDGASMWDIFWKITLPTVMPFVSVNIIYVVVNLSIMGDFAGVLQEASYHIGGGPADVRYFGYGYASTITWIYFILMVMIIGLFVGILSIRGRREIRAEKRERKRTKRTLAKAQKQV